MCANVCACEPVDVHGGNGRALGPGDARKVACLPACIPVSSPFCSAVALCVCVGEHMFMCVCVDVCVSEEGRERVSHGAA